MPTGTLPRTLAELIHDLGDIPLERIATTPALGLATEADVLRGLEGEKRLYELVDGVLVEKPMGYYESLLAAILIRSLGDFVEANDLGITLGEAGTLRLAPGLVRVPDVSFIAWSRFPDRKLPDEPLPDLSPDLPVEVLSQGNTKREMDRKVREYFEAGAQLVWLADPERRTVAVYRSPAEVRNLGMDDTLSGGDVLPGFELPIRDWFDRFPRG